MLEKAAEMVNIEIDAVLGCCRPGVRESEVYAALFSASLRAGAEAGRDSWLIMCSGKGYPVNRRPTDRILRTGDMMCIGYYSRYGGYWSHPHTSMSLGPMDEEYKPIHAAVKECLHAALEALKPGTPWSEVDRASNEASPAERVLSRNPPGARGGDRRHRAAHDDDMRGRHSPEIPVARAVRGGKPRREPRMARTGGRPLRLPGGFRGRGRACASPSKSRPRTRTGFSWSSAPR